MSPASIRLLLHFFLNCLPVLVVGIVSPVVAAMTDGPSRACVCAPPLHSAYDHLGSTSLITNAHGRRLDRLVYSPWGVPLTGNFSRTRFGYTGHQWEKATGNWYGMWRYLDPRAGRWTQGDPSGAADGPNRYVYVVNAPITFIDPLGLKVRVAQRTGQQRLFTILKSLLKPPECVSMSPDGQLAWTGGDSQNKAAVWLKEMIEAKSQEFVLIPSQSLDEPDAQWEYEKIYNPKFNPLLYQSLRDTGGGSSFQGFVKIAVTANLGILEDILAHELYGHTWTWWKGWGNYWDELVADAVGGQALGRPLRR